MGFIGTGVPGLDFILGGGLPKSYLVTVTGLPGTGKTVLIQQIAAHHAGQGGRVLYATGLSEGHVSIVANLRAFTFLDPALLGDRIKIVNVLPVARTGLSAVTSTLIRTVTDEGISFVIFDGFRALRDVAGDERAARSFLYELSSMLTSISTTGLVIGEKDIDTATDDPEVLAADGVVAVRARWTGNRVHRTVEVVKMRGVRAVRGPHSLHITDAGVAVFPRPETIAEAAAPARWDERVSTGSAQLDRLLRGGLPRGGTILVAGSPASGKTTLALSFLAAGAATGETGVLASLDQGGADLAARARAMGMTLGGEAVPGRVTLLQAGVGELDPDRLAWELWQEAERGQARRVVIDSLLPLFATLARERWAGYFEAVFARLRARGATVMVTCEAAGGALPFGDLPAPVTRVADTVLLMQTAEEAASVRHRLVVARMRGSDHDRTFHYYSPGEKGLHLLD